MAKGPGPPVGDGDLVLRSGAFEGRFCHVNPALAVSASAHFQVQDLFHVLVLTFRILVVSCTVNKVTK